jgi:antitoxin ParD1/3/4
MPRTSRPITVTLGDLQPRVEARLKSRTYTSASEVLRAAIRALDREEAAIVEWLRQQVEEGLNDPRPNIPAKKVFAHLREHHAKRKKAERPEKV